MPYSTRNGLKIHYEVHGEGPAMIFIHANPFDRRLWMYQVARFSPFYRVIAVDLRGYGLSDKPETKFDLRDMTDDVLGICKDEGISKAIFAGCSVGSGIAMLIGLEHPQLAQAVILVGGSSAGPRNAEAIAAGFQNRDLSEYLMSLMRGYVAPGFADTPTGQWLLKLFVENAHNLSAKCIGQIFRARGSYDMTSRLPGMKTPALIINGAHDMSLDAGTYSASLIPGAQHAVLPNTGHACCIEDPAAFDAAMIKFLKQHDLAPAGALRHN